MFCDNDKKKETTAVVKNLMNEPERTKCARNLF